MGNLARGCDFCGQQCGIGGLPKCTGRLHVEAMEARKARSAAKPAEVARDPVVFEAIVPPEPEPMPGTYADEVLPGGRRRPRKLQPGDPLFVRVDREKHKERMKRYHRKKKMLAAEEAARRLVEMEIEQAESVMDHMTLGPAPGGDEDE